MRLNTKKIGVSALAAAMVTAFTGCSVATKEAKDDFVKTSEIAVKKADIGLTKIPAKPLFSKTSNVFVDPEPMVAPLDPEVSLPPVFKKEISMNFQVKAGLSEIIARAQRASDVTFAVLPEVYEMNANQQQTGGAGVVQKTGADSTSVGKGQPQSNTGAVFSGAVTSEGADVMVNDMIYKGSLQGFLDQLTAKTNLTWKWDGHRVVIYRYETKIFTIDALAGAATSSANVGGSSQSSSGSDSSGSSGSASMTSGQQTSMTTFSQIWTEIGDTVKSQLSGKGKMSLMPSAGTVTVTDTPSNLARISNFLNGLNKSVGKQVMINVEIYSVETKDNDNYGIDWDVVWKTANSKFNLAASTISANGASAIAGNLKATIVNSSSPFNGTSAIVGALSTLGKTSLVSSASVVTLNGLPAPVNVTKEEAYLKEVTTTMSTQGTTETAYKPGLLTTGLSMTLTPRMGEGDKVLLQYSMDLSNKLAIDTFGNIQIPSKSVRNFLQRVSMRSGQTLILSGFQQTTADNNESGIASAKNWPVGGKKNNTSANTTLVVMITPYVME